MQVVLRQRFDGGKFPQSEPPATTPALHPLSGASPSPRDIHSKSSLQPASLLQGDTWHRVDAFPHILVGGPGLQLLINDESLCLCWIAVCSRLFDSSSCVCAFFVASFALTHQAWRSASTSTQAAAAVGSPLCFDLRKAMAAVGSPSRIAMSTRAVLR